MKRKLYFLAVLIASVTIALAQSAPQARVLRLMSDKDGKWRFSVDGTNDVLVSSDDLTNKMAQLRMRHGDVLLLGSLPVYTNPAESTWRWLSSTCESNKVAVYLYAVNHPLEAAKLFSVPVYNWKAPFENPRGLEHAVFFREGQFLGCGATGFQVMVDEIARTRPKRIFILGSLYDLYQQFGPREHPFETEDPKLDAVLKRNGTDLIILEPEFGL